MKCSVYIATSADGYIATAEGSVDWLDTAGNPDADMSDNPDMGFNDFIASVDCMIMGRKCMEVIASFALTPEQWPYGDTKIYVLSHSLAVPPENLLGKVEMYAGDIPKLINRLKSNGFKHAYIDGGATITSFINLQLINEMTISKAPVILGDGIPLFGKVDQNIKLVNSEVTVFPNDFIQIRYGVSYL
ncbi:MAG: dihydrofolate reductase [Colwellia sp.]|nr:dihydrofolate reductase [Colwellia sp.]